MSWFSVGWLGFRLSGLFSLCFGGVLSDFVDRCIVMSFCYNWL